MTVGTKLFDFSRLGFPRQPTKGRHNADLSESVEKTMWDDACEVSLKKLLVATTTIRVFA